MSESKGNLVKGLIENLSIIKKESYLDPNFDQTTEVEQILDLIKCHRRIICENQNLSKIVTMIFLPFMYSRNSVFKINIMKILRYFLVREETWQFMVRLRYDIALVRIIYECFSFDNECKHAVMIIAKALKICPHLMPNSIIYCLNNFSSDTSYHKSRHIHNIIGLISMITFRKSNKMSIYNITQTLIEYCANPLSNNVIIETTMTLLLSLYEDPKKRSILFDKGVFESILAPFTDNHFISGQESNENREDFVYKSCNIALVGLRVMLRSWTGIVIFFGFDGCFRSLLKVLPHSSSLIQGIILNILCDMFFLDHPDCNKDFDTVLTSLESMQKHVDKFENHDIVQEMLSVLKPSRKNAIDVINLFKAIVIHSCISLDLVQILIETILLLNEEFVKNISKIILGELLYFSYNFLPQPIQIENHFKKLLKESALLCNNKQTEIRNILTHVSQYQNFKNSLTFESRQNNVMKYSIINEDENFDTQFWFDEKRGDEKIAFNNKEQSQLEIDINNTRIFTSTSECWSWEKIKKIFFKYSPIIIDKNIDSIRYKFMLTLKNFYIPSRSNFYSIKCTSSIANLASDVAFLFFNTLLHPNQSNDAIQWVNEFMISIANILETFNSSNPIIPIDTSLPKSNIKFMEFLSSLQDCLSIQYFTLIRFVQRFKIGRSIVENSQILIKIYNIIESSELIGFIKAVIPNMNYQHITSQKILGLLIAKGSHDIKLFCIDFLRAYSRLKKENNFVVNFLSQLINDVDEQVAEEASDVLDEILDNDINICIDLISKNVPYLHLGNIGIKILSRIITTISRKSSSYQKLAKFFPKLSQEWCSKYLNFYVEKFESRLSNSFKGCISSFETNYETKKTIPKEFNLSTYKIEKFVNIEELPKMSDIIVNKKSPDYESLKKKLLFIANYASSRKGAEALEKLDPNIFQKIVNLIYHCEKISIRWFGIIAMNIISTNKSSEKLLKNVNWVVYNNEPKNWLQSTDYFLKYNDKSQNTSLNSLREYKLQKLQPKSSIVFEAYKSEEKNLKTGYSLDTDSSQDPINIKDVNFEETTDQQNKNLTLSVSTVPDIKKIIIQSQENNKEIDDSLFIDSNSTSKDINLLKDKYSASSLIDMQDFTNIKNIEEKSKKYMCLPIDILQCYAITEFYKMVSAIDSIGSDSNKSKDERKKNIDYSFMATDKSCVYCSNKQSETTKNFDLLPCNRYNKSTYKTSISICPIKEDMVKFIGESSGDDIQDRLKIEREIVCLIFNMVTQNMFNSGTKIINELKAKYPTVFSDSCYYTFLFDQCVSYNMKPRQCKLINSLFSSCNWTYYLDFAKNLLLKLEL